jgi:cell division protein ZapA
VKQVEVKIMDQGYLLGAPEGGEQRLREAAHKVDAAMSKIRDAGKLKARDRIAVLAALNLAFEQLTPAPASADDPDGARPQLSAAYQANLSALLKRLDQALSDDGQLL